MKGDYRERQLQANRLKCDAYIEHHFNSGSASGNYAVAVVGTNASKKSIDWAEAYSRAIAREFGIEVKRKDNQHAIRDGVFLGGWDGQRGNANLLHTLCPAILLEPLFAGNPKHAAIIRSTEGRLRLARVLVQTIRRFFPHGGHIAFSVGHKYKSSNTRDRGAPVFGGRTEADFAELVLIEAKTMLETGK